jgi:RNase P subunit RPR2
MWAPTVSARHAAYPERTEPKERYDVVTSLPDASTRWRCSGCGNLTRFDVTRTRRTTEFWHFDLAGDHRVEESTTDHEDVSAVTCRWCGRSDAVELVSRAETDASTA